jgi:hypothetical protein
VTLAENALEDDECVNVERSEIPQGGTGMVECENARMLE